MSGLFRILRSNLRQARPARLRAPGSGLCVCKTTVAVPVGIFCSNTAESFQGVAGLELPEILRDGRHDLRWLRRGTLLLTWAPLQQPCRIASVSYTNTAHARLSLLKSDAAGSRFGPRTGHDDNHPHKHESDRTLSHCTKKENATIRWKAKYSMTRTQAGHLTGPAGSCDAAHGDLLYALSWIFLASV